MYEYLYLDGFKIRRKSELYPEWRNRSFDPCYLKTKRR